MMNAWYGAMPADFSIMPAIALPAGHNPGNCKAYRRWRLVGASADSFEAWLNEEPAHVMACEWHARATSWLEAAGLAVAALRSVV